ncbi:MAG: NADH-quinone oxidoreductase subunit N [Anaerolineales bacterium]
MFSGSFDTTMLLAIAPEILILVLAVLILILDLILSKERRGNLGWVTAGGLAVILVVSLVVARPESEPTMIWGGMLRHDNLGFYFRMMFVFAAAITALLSVGLPKIGNRGEFYVLLLVSTLGMSLMAASADLIMLYLAIETTAVPLYVLAGFLIRDKKSTEAGFKYILFGAMTSAIMLYGFSLLYGFTGTTNIYGLTQSAQADQISIWVIFGTLLLVLVGFGFKISAVPLHFWAPDVYEGAPTQVTGFLSTASKAAGFAVLVRVLLAVFPAASPYWGALLAAIAIATMTLGNLIAIAQKNIKRMLAYSSIAHAGYAMIGIVAISSLGLSSMVLYLVVYLITNLAAFGVVVAYGRIIGSDEIADYAGMSRRSPWLALVLLIAFLSLAGMPPFGGFVAKFAVFAAAVDADMIWLAVIGVLNAIVGLYYYLTVLKYVYLYHSEDDEKPISIQRSYALALGVLTIGIILIGILFGPWFEISRTAAAALF